MKAVVGVTMCERMVAESQSRKEALMRFGICTATVGEQSLLTERKEVRWRCSNPAQDFMISRIVDILVAAAEEGRDNESFLRPWKKLAGCFVDGRGSGRINSPMVLIALVKVSGSWVPRSETQLESVERWRDLIRAPWCLIAVTTLRVRSRTLGAVLKCTDSSSSAPLERFSMVKVLSRQSGREVSAGIEAHKTPCSSITPRQFLHTRDRGVKLQS